MPEYDGQGGKAFRAVSSRNRSGHHFALVCDTTLPARMDVAGSLRDSEPAGLLALGEAMTVDWPPAGGRRTVLVYTRPAGSRVVRNLDSPFGGFSEDALIRTVVQPVVGALRDLELRGITHGAIRPDNMFFRDGAGSSILLGDCVSVPSGYGQPAFFETIERAMADPVGRGPGSIADDLFALGATVLWLAVGGNPAPDVDDAEMLAQRLDRGSYTAMCGPHRFSQTIQELLRGLLADDPRQRWSLKELDLLLAGRRPSPRHATLPKRAPRPLDVGGKPYWTARGVAFGLAVNPGAAVSLIETGELDKWLRRSLADEAVADAAAQAAASGGGSGGPAGTHQHRLVARVVMALDPRGPIRYRGRSVLPDGIGTALYAAYAGGGAPSVFGEIIAAQLPGFWMSVQTEARPELAGLVQIFDSLRVLLDSVMVGYGLERILYEMNPAAPCLSPMVAGDRPATPGELLSALDAVGRRKNRPDEPMDRHLAAFLLARHRKLDDRLFTVLAHGQPPSKRVLGILTILADTQHVFGPSSCPGITAWMQPLLRSAVDRIRNRERHAQMGRDVESIAAEGDLRKLLQVVDDANVLREDAHAFVEAQREHARLGDQIRQLERSTRDKVGVIETEGRQIAAIASGILASIICFGIVAVKLGGIG
ncbi:MAG TPA: serine/threonine protein kinase [Azospirillaceae bacterium]|nr:serine/threonine protein kinase [Azospirillaceae bacterium]